MKRTLQKIKPTREKVILVLILINAFIIRYIGLKFSYPLLTHADEWISLNPVHQMTLNKTLDSGAYYRPDQVLLYINLLFLNIASYIKFGKNLGLTYYQNQLFFYHFSRLIIAVIGTALPLAAWKLGKLTKINFSIPAALLFAFYPSYVLHSHYITPDVTITLLTLLVILAAGQYLHTGNTQWSFLAAFLAALNTTEKYPGLLSLGIVYFAVLLFEINKNQRINIHWVKNLLLRFLQCALIYAASLYVIAPNLFIEYGKVIQAIKNEARSTHLGADNLGWFGNMAFYIDQFLNQANWLVLVFIAAGIIAALLRRELGLWVAVYGFFYWIALSKLDLHWERWALPMYISPLLFAAYGAGSLSTLKLRRINLRYPVYFFFGIAVAGLGLHSLSNSIRMTYQDTRYAALQYCQENGITEDNSLFESYTPFSPVLYGGPNFHERYKEHNIYAFYILSSNMYNRYYFEPQRYMDQIANYEEIKTNNVLIAEFKPTNDGKLSIKGQIDAVVYYLKRVLGQKLSDRFTGPVIQIYQSGG